MRYKQFIITGLLSLILVSCKTARDKYTELPFDLTSGGILIPVVVNGDSLDFIFDTGASISLLYKDSLTGGHKYATTITNFIGEKDTFPIVGIEKLSIGTIDLYDQKLACAKKPDHVKHDGIIGNDIARNYFVKVDFLKKKIVFHNQADSSDTDSLKTSIWIANNLPYTVLNFGTTSDTFLIDTGFSRMIKLKNDLFDRVVSTDSSAEWLEKYSISAFDRVAEGNMRRKYGLVDIRMGSQLFKNQLVESDSLSQNLIGKSFFQQYAFMTLDNEGFTVPMEPFMVSMQMSVENSPLFDSTIAISSIESLGGLVKYINSIGINFEMEPGGRAVVSGLRQEASPKNNLLQLGDTLIGYDSILFGYQRLYSEQEISRRGYQILPDEILDSLIEQQCFTDKNTWTFHFEKNGQLRSLPIQRRLVYQSDEFHFFGHYAMSPITWKGYFTINNIDGGVYFVKPNLLGSDRQIKSYSNGKEL